MSFIPCGMKNMTHVMSESEHGVKLDHDRHERDGVRDEAHDRRHERDSMPHPAG
jgi:hypothetical protein